jgi:hypothetical protein
MSPLKFFRRKKHSKPEVSAGSQAGTHLSNKVATPSLYRDLEVQDYYEKKLYEIRVFMLLPGEEAEEIRGHILHAYLDAPYFPPRYEALSYFWGDPTDTVSITILGSTAPELPEFAGRAAPFEIPDPQKRVIGQLQITKNLNIALHALRRGLLQDEHRILWIDAICINQSDSNEKTIQIGLMQNIYQSATRVTVWLGDPMPFSDRGLDALDVIFHVDFEVPLFSAYYTRGKSRLGLLYLMQRSWWQRMWVIQEIVFARKARLLCGDRSVIWPSLNRLDTIISKLKQVIQITSSRQHEHGTGLENLLEILQIQSRIMKEPKPSLLDLVELFQTRQCTDRRDRVFAILGLAAEEDSKENPPDYSMTLPEVQMRLFRMAIPKLQGLQFLNCSGGYIEKPGRSSWILEWDSEVTGMSDTSSGRLRPRLGFTSLIVQEPYFRKFESSRRARPEVSFRTGLEGLCLLSLKAIVVDSINICEEQFKSQRVDDNQVAIPRQYFWPDDDPVPLMREWRDLAYEHCAVASSPYGTIEGAIEEAFWRTLIADSDPDPSKAGRKADVECERGYNRLFKATDADEHLQDSGDHETPKDNASVFPQLENDKQLKVLGITHFSNLSGGTRFMEHQAVLNDEAEAILGERIWGGDGDIGLNVQVHIGLGESSGQVWNINPACTEPPGLPWSELYPDPKQFNCYNVGLQRSTFPRRFTITKKGYMGLTPPKAQVGDLICVFIGASTPFVVREMEDGYFRLVGECYVHGLMDGEAMDDLLAGKLKEQTITLA